MASSPSLPADLGTTSLDVPGFSTNAGQSLEVAGTSFGELIKGVGKAVADTQRSLAESSARTTEALASTTVNIVAVRSVTYDDNGTISGTQSFVRKLPLIDFVDPTFYQWTQVRLQGQFFIQELASTTSARSSSFSSRDNSEQHGLFVFLGGGQTSTGFTSTETTVDTQVDRAQAFARVRMYAQLNPRTDVGVPRPTLAVRGPSMQIIQGEVADLPAPGADPLTGRTMELLIQLRKADGTAIAGKSVSVETDGIPWEFSGSDTSDASGNIPIALTRSFLPVPAGAPAGTVQDTAAIETVVTVRLGLVSNSVTVAI